jgi:hypothetical protein
MKANIRLMKKHVTYVLAFALVLFMKPAFAQNVAINTDGSLPDNNAILDIKSSTKGILIPRLSSSARIAVPATKCLLVYDTTTNSFWYHTGIAWQNLAAGSGSWSLNGNSDVNSANFIGTMDNTPFIIKVNNQLSAFLTSADTQVTSFGYRAGAGNTTGSDNTAIGRASLFANSSGNKNTAVGANALANTSGSGNTAMGSYALQLNTTGYFNEAIGVHSLYHNTTGSSNVAIGNSTLYENTTGTYNTAIGSGSLMLDSSGSNNTVLGGLSLQLNRTGSFNTAIGFSTLQKNFTGTNNTAIGSQADVGSSNLTNATALGYGAIADASNKVRIGNSAVTVIEGQVPFTTPSDGRFKFNVQEDVKGLEFITQLRPVTYQFDVKRFDAQYASTSSNNVVQWANYNEAVMMRRSGFIAQEVERAAIATGYNFSGIIKPTTEQDHYGLSYESFVVPLVKAVQELNKKLEAENNELRKKLEAQNNRQEEQNTKLTSLQQQLDALKQLLLLTK